MLFLFAYGIGSVIFIGRMLYGKNNQQPPRKRGTSTASAGGETMGKSFKVFTIENGSVKEGAVAETLHLKGAGVDIPAIFVGEQGRGRERGVLPVQLPSMLQAEWKEKGQVRISSAEVGTTKAGKPKIYARAGEGVDADDSVICVFRTHIGFRGGNSHTGDRTGQAEKDAYGDERITFLEFPGDVLVNGYIAQGMAGRAGGGQQLVATMPKDVVFRTGYSGRLYGTPAAHYYLWDGERLLAVTWDERVASDIF
ncbi:MAG: hypothetical protein HGA33_02010 [Candidatus Moranbacteria bacterium]|nr:hypothetical protein [Candidatus Moranbacteria bacterium]